MARSFIGYLLIVAVISAEFSRLFVFAGFELNRNYIAAHLCVNRSKPWLHCNGKCYFMKKMKEAQQRDKNAENQAQKNLFQDAFFPMQDRIQFYTQVLRVMRVPRGCINLPQVELPIFRPPQLS